jgi:hypothetical protein
MDPQDDGQGEPWGRHVIDRRAFERIWYDTDTHRYTLVRRWYMVVSFEECDLTPTPRSGPVTPNCNLVVA